MFNYNPAIVPYDRAMPVIMPDEIEYLNVMREQERIRSLEKQLPTIGQTITRVQILLRQAVTRAGKALFPIELLMAILEEAGLLDARHRRIGWRRGVVPTEFDDGWSGTERMRVYNVWKRHGGYRRGML